MKEKETHKYKTANVDILLKSSQKRNISAFSVILIFTCLLIVGLFFIPMLPVKLSPSKTLPQVTVNFNMWGQSSRIIEMEVTSKIESMLSRIKGIENISSNSGNGWGNVSVRINKHTDLDMVRFEISTIIRQLYPSLPPGVSYPSITMNRPEDDFERPFISYTINAPTTPILIQKFAENHIKSRLLQIKGIDKVEINGATPMIWKLEYDYFQLQNLGISVDDIKEAIQLHLKNEFLGIGTIENSDKEKQWIRLAIVPNTPNKTFDISQIDIKTQDKKIIRLDQIVSAKYIESEPYSYYRINGLNSIYLSVKAKEDANQLAVCNKVKDVINNIDNIIPPNYEIHLAYDATEYIQKELNKIYFRSGLTILILLGFVFLIYRNIKYLILILFSLLCNIFIAAILYYLFQLEIQLYSLIGITISLTLVIDNTIVMSDQIIRRKNKKAFMSILAATLTTIASLITIFFMDENIRLNLQDFANVLIINLIISLLIALFLVPALIEKLHIDTPSIKQKKQYAKRLKKRKQFNISFNKGYEKFIIITSRFRTTIIILLILLFGLPLFMLPSQIDTSKDKHPTFAAKCYNKTLGSNFYKENIKPIVDIAFGGTLRLFIQKVYNGSYWSNKEETTLFIGLSMPNGSTLTQTNYIIGQIENYLQQYKEIKQFETNVSTLQASINIKFVPKHQNSGFPHLLKSKLISKALEQGGGSWNIEGLGNGFNNSIKDNAGPYRVKMLGYNYDHLHALAEQFKDSLQQNKRIKKFTINSRFSYFKNDYQEYSFNLKKDKLIEQNITPIQLYNNINPMFGKDIYVERWKSGSSSEEIKLFSKQANEYDIWKLKYFPGQINKNNYKLSELADIEKGQSPQNIAKENQQYRLCLQYDYIGPSKQGNNILLKTINNFEKILPLGYSIENGMQNQISWGQKNNKQYWSMILIIIIIYFTTSILFNSLKQPFTIIFIIPISFIGIFLTFYWFRLNFDQGGFAAFIILCGLTVNASIYILNEYNNILKTKKIPPIKAYIKAWNAKISPIFLTIVSTILGFLPFIIGAEKEGFWFPLAAGSIGGLIMSFIGIFLFMPLFTGIGQTNKT